MARKFGLIYQKKQSCQTVVSPKLSCHSRVFMHMYFSCNSINPVGTVSLINFIYLFFPTCKVPKMVVCGRLFLQYKM